ncbi:MAG: peptidase dimerization domain-containing protein, partial [Oscillospiraceae bacterium]|nr:peptidase dimerization domain-containing protein [Oscillospiraceae bacterium]
GSNNASVDHFTITVKGKAAHVSTPHLGADAVYMASQIVVALQSIVTRLSSPVEPLLIGVGKVTAGDAYNIVADSAVLEGTVRAVTVQARKEAQERLNSLCESVATFYGGIASVEWEDFAPQLVNPADICKEAGDIITGLLGDDVLVTNRTLSLGGDDFARFQEKIPGVYAYLGSSTPDKPDTCRPLHNEKFDLEEAVLPTGAALHAEYALAYLTGRVG